MTLDRAPLERAGYTVSADPARLDFVAVHAFLTRSFWSPGIPLDVVRKAAAQSLCFGVYHGDAQVGYARVVTDGTTFAYLCDVYVLEEHRGQGLSVWLVETVLAHPDLQGLRRFMLVTRDAGGLYARFGFATPPEPSGVMVLRGVPGYLQQGRSAATSNGDAPAAPPRTASTRP